MASKAGKGGKRVAHVSLDGLIRFGNLSDLETMDLIAPMEKNGYLVLQADALRECSRIAFTKIAYLMPETQYDAFAKIIEDPEASEYDRFVASCLLENALISGKRRYPICQDTGTALVYGWRGDRIEIEKNIDLEELLVQGAAQAWTQEKLRNSQMGPLNMMEECNTKDNLPAGIQIRSIKGKELRLTFVAKGGGSASRSSISIESPAILRADKLENVLRLRINALGPSGCPPYAIAMVLGGTNPAQSLYAAELAALGLLDNLPTSANGDGMPMRDILWEKKMLTIARDSGFGAQWGGSHFAVSTRAIRLSRHAANLPLAIAVSCAANRHVSVFIDNSGWYIEKLSPPSQCLENKAQEIILQTSAKAEIIQITQSDDSWLSKLRSLQAGSMALISGPVLLARDMGHARLLRMLESDKKLPDWFIGLPVFYAGPTEAKQGAKTGAFGPTSASRMDSYLEAFMKVGASIVTIAKGSRSNEARRAIATHRGVYCAAIGGVAALNAERFLQKLDTIQFEDLGMEAVRIAVIDRLPVIIAIDSHGKDIYDS
jgi:fumarate hydratase class I